jgi:hypothetical protein
MYFKLNLLPEKFVQALITKPSKMVIAINFFIKMPPIAAIVET